MNMLELGEIGEALGTRGQGDKEVREWLGGNVGCLGSRGKGGVKSIVTNGAHDISVVSASPEGKVQIENVKVPRI